MITRETDYSIRLVLAMAIRQRKGVMSVSSAEVAKDMDIPYRFLRKLVVQLVNGGLIETRRGKGGGMALARSPESISLYDVVAITGPRGVEFSPCVSDPKTCDRSVLCRIHREFTVIQHDVDKRLKSVQIADMV